MDNVERLYNELDESLKGVETLYIKVNKQGLETNARSLRDDLIYETGKSKGLRIAIRTLQEEEMSVNE